MSTFETFGQLLLGFPRLGDGEASPNFPRGTALATSYSIVPALYNAPLSLTYTLQHKNTAILLAYYLITPTPVFAINGDATIIKPDKITYPPRTVSGRTLLGGPILQGYSSMVWQYTTLTWPEFNKIIGYYNPQNPVVQLTYPDQSGTWHQKSAVMLPPSYGQMTTFLITSVTLTFTRLI